MAAQQSELSRVITIGPSFDRESIGELLIWLGKYFSRWSRLTPTPRERRQIIARIQRSYRVVPNPHFAGDTFVPPTEASNAPSLAAWLLALAITALDMEGPASKQRLMYMFYLGAWTK